MISQSSIDFARALIAEIDGQDNRATASPYFYVIQERHVQPVPDDLGDEIHYYDSNQVESYESADDILEHYNEEDHRFDDITALLDACPWVRRYEAKIEWHDKGGSNVFFTQAAYEQHLRENGHNLTQPRSYIKHAFRNPEIAGVLDVLREVAGFDATDTQQDRT